ncbi:MAG: DUF971 domain-containing protein [Acidobacteriota bacterium]
MHYPKTDTALIEFRRLPDERQVALSWDDGARARLTYDQLQGYCPCAHCRGHGPGDITFQAPKQPVRSLAVAPVGQYAVSLAFEPGCNAGIFPFDFLRELARREDTLDE